MWHWRLTSKDMTASQCSKTSATQGQTCSSLPPGIFLTSLVTFAMVTASCLTESFDSATSKVDMVARLWRSAKCLFHCLTISWVWVNINSPKQTPARERVVFPFSHWHKLSELTWKFFYDNYNKISNFICLKFCFCIYRIYNPSESILSAVLGVHQENQASKVSYSFMASISTVILYPVHT